MTGPWRDAPEGDFLRHVRRAWFGYFGNFTDSISGGLGVGYITDFWRPTRRMIERKLDNIEARSRAEISQNPSTPASRGAEGGDAR